MVGLHPSALSSLGRQEWSLLLWVTLFTVSPPSLLYCLDVLGARLAHVPWVVFSYVPFKSGARAGTGPRLQYQAGAPLLKSLPGWIPAPPSFAWCTAGRGEGFLSFFPRLPTPDHWEGQEPSTNGVALPEKGRTPEQDRIYLWSNSWVPKEAQVSLEVGEANSERNEQKKGSEGFDLLSRP